MPLIQSIVGSRGKAICAAVLVSVAALAAVPLAGGEPPSIRDKRAEARAVLVQIRELDSRLEKSVEAYNLGRIKLERTERDLRTNDFELGVARRNLKRAEDRLAARVVDLYTSESSGSVLEIVLGARSLGDLLDRVETADRVADQDALVLAQVKTFHAGVREQRVRLKAARARQRELLAELERRKASINAQIAGRQRLLDSIKSEIVRLQAEERARQERLRQEALARLAAAKREARLARQQAARRHDDAPALEEAEPVVGAAAITPEGITVAPPSRYGGVVGIAMQYLGIPYKWGGASPAEGFDCSGFIMYVYAQVGVSLPHYAAAQYNYGVPVSKDQLEAGDLVFFDGLGHNGIYIGGGQFIHAPHTGDVVKISSLSDPWYTAKWVGARRL